MIKDDLFSKTELLLINDLSKRTPFSNIDIGRSYLILKNIDLVEIASEISFRYNAPLLDIVYEIERILKIKL